VGVDRPRRRGCSAVARHRDHPYADLELGWELPHRVLMEEAMSKRTSKRATRRKKGANHGKRPNGN
jgi:hypothetical protein